MDRKEYDNLSPKMKLEKLQEFENIIKKERLKINNENYYCEGCTQYFPKLNAKEFNKRETVRECVYQDCGYGDDDEYADVTYLCFYTKCPYCGAWKRTRKLYIKEENRHGRYG